MKSLNFILPVCNKRIMKSFVSFVILGCTVFTAAQEFSTTDQVSECKFCVAEQHAFRGGMCTDMTFDECQEQNVLIMDDAPSCFQAVEECDELCPIRDQLKAESGKCYDVCAFEDECFESIFTKNARGRGRRLGGGGCAAGTACQKHHHSAFAIVGICVPQESLQPFDVCLTPGCTSTGAVVRPDDCPTDTACQPTHPIFGDPSTHICISTSPVCSSQCHDNACCECRPNQLGLAPIGEEAWIACSPPLPCADGSHPKPIEGECCAFEQCPVEPKYSCLTKELWTPAKQEYCCEHAKLGCQDPCQASEYFSLKPGKVKKTLKSLKKKRNKTSKKYQNLMSKQAKEAEEGLEVSQKQQKKLSNYKKKMTNAKDAFNEINMFVESCL